MFKWLPVMLLAATSVGFVSCGDDDEEVVPAAESGVSGSSAEEQPAVVNVPENTPEGVEAVDLGLPSGTKWANMNLGATSETGYGSFFAWGETVEKSTFGWGTYQYGSDKDNVANIGADIAGTKYDAARMKWGGAWAMPTDSQIRELLNHTTSEWTTEGGVRGRIFYGDNGNWIFLPASGFYESGDYWGRGTYGDYWSSTVSPSNSAEAFLLEFLSGKQYAGATLRCQGCAIRPVITGKSSGGENGGGAVTPSSGSTFTVKGVSFTMVPVEGGTFQMGATLEQGSDAYYDEKPVHNVTLSNFSIGQTEVTQALWTAVMGSNPSSYKGNNLPVECVSWNDCQTFITKLNQLTGKNFRLPTEAEWEYAARGGKQSKGYKYSGSNTIGDVAWYTENSSSKTHTVATKLPNELGLYDMSGNVYEWCLDWYGAYSSSAQSNPTGVSSGSYRVLRGGGRDYVAGFCRVSCRNRSTPSNTSDYLGFRLAL